MALKSDLYEEFDSDIDIIDYYGSKLTRRSVDKLGELFDVQIEGKRVESDLEDLLEDGVIETYHEYNAALHGIGNSAVIDGIKKIESEKLRELSENQMEDGSFVIVKLVEWEWFEELSTIQALHSFQRKRSIQRNKIGGEPRFDNIDDHLDEIEELISESVQRINDERRLKADFHRVESLDEKQYAVRLNIEQKGSKYRQFRFRDNDDDVSSDTEGSFESEVFDYWPIKTRDVIIDVENNEYSHNITKSPEDFIDPILSAFFENSKDKGSIWFLDPLEHPEETPHELVDSRVGELRDQVEDEVDDPDKEEEYKAILDDIETVEQKAITLENINVPGDPLEIHIEAGETIDAVVEKNDWEEQFEKFNKNSENIEYTLMIGDDEVEVYGDTIKVPPGVDKDRRDVLTGLLQKEGVAL